jgi:hypothetical protein
LFLQEQIKDIITKKWTFVHTKISFHHTINIESHRKIFVHTIYYDDDVFYLFLHKQKIGADIFKITPSLFCSHHQDVDHPLENLLHTI